MEKIRVLVVDDAALIRKVLSDLLNEDPHLEVCGTAPNGVVALQKIASTKPDIVTLDIEMPEMSGLQAIIEIRKSHPSLPVIMFSALTEHGATQTLEALAHGANDYLTKPSGMRDLEAAKSKIRTELGAKIRGLCAPRRGTATPTPSVPHVFPAQRVLTEPISILGIGVSTGGPNALSEVLPSLPGDLNVPILITQHMPPVFTKMLAERLDSKSKIAVHEGAEGMPIEPGHAYIAPGGWHMVVKRKGGGHVLSINQEPPENSCRPAVDVMFRSIAREFAGTSLGIVLTGMGSDGLKGCHALRDAGGEILIQDEKTSVVWGMPGVIAQAGIADQILAIDRMAPAILERLVARNRSEQRRTAP